MNEKIIKNKLINKDITIKNQVSKKKEKILLKKQTKKFDFVKTIWPINEIKNEVKEI